jgi:hypothetical protein
MGGLCGDEVGEGEMNDGVKAHTSTENRVLPREIRVGSDHFSPRRAVGCSDLFACAGWHMSCIRVVRADLPNLRQLALARA